MNINAIDFGAAFLPQNQDPTQTQHDAGRGRRLEQPDAGVSAATATSTCSGTAAGATYHSLQLSFQRRFQNGLSFGFNDTIGLSDRQQAGVRLQHDADGSLQHPRRSGRGRRAARQQQPGAAHVLRANFIWDLPDLRSSATAAGRRSACLVNDWQISGIWSGARRGANVTAGNSNVPSRRYTVGFSYANGGGNQNLTGSPDYGARIVVVGDPGNGCSSDPLRQFNTSAFRGPAVGSVGLESGNDYLHGLLHQRARPRDSRATSGSAARATSSCASTCSTR